MQNINNKTKPTLFLFTDGSANPQLNIGYGAYLLLNEDELYLSDSKKNIQIKRFDNTTSSKLELQAMIWALNEITLENCRVIIFTDCQNTIGLKDRRERFEKNNYMTKKNIQIKNHELYKEFYEATDKYDCIFVKVKGHKKSEEKDDIDKIFTLVDRASRDALRGSLS